MAPSHSCGNLSLQQLAQGPPAASGEHHVWLLQRLQQQGMAAKEKLQVKRQSGVCHSASSWAQQPALAVALQLRWVATQPLIKEAASGTQPSQEGQAAALPRSPGKQPRAHSLPQESDQTGCHKRSCISSRQVKVSRDCSNATPPWTTASRSPQVQPSS
ncbi:hypothetical protein NDU88_002218 [Pleurodeles waltl]|uniref:Uncharacterized protein n=1 Tax=Pleurodeles waltl TaxID=8319 RepID=A0AAV7TLC0_PLEWA|nr:hypothetical protein NDU88_002218 [Pleurodeles waltl]